MGLPTETAENTGRIIKQYAPILLYFLELGSKEEVLPYFIDHYDAVRYPRAVGNIPGLRNAQLGALHAIGAHFTIRTDPALVTLPTGTGKTLVLTLAPFLCRAQRVLVVTPGRLVRNQIAQDIKAFRTARLLRTVDAATPSPHTHELLHRVRTPQEWEALRSFDVVVATPPSISPTLVDIPPPPPDLFDLLLLDEAHHTPAQTWHDVMAAFPNAKKILFTATPYRRDRKEIKATIIYTYPVKLAYEEGIFGRIRYLPVTPMPAQAHDITIATATAGVFAADRAAGLQHCVMVRTDRKKRANALKKIYDDHTPLRLHVIHSGLTYKTIQRTLDQLRNGTLDGIICVDMMSEGFDFPQLKIAAIHIPHKSLEVTLQFIGRFARTNTEHVGEAKFLAIPDQIKTETKRLYAENAIWEELIIDLSEQRLAAETQVREMLEQFEEPLHADLNTQDLSLYALWPYFHVKTYQVTGPIDLTQELRLPIPFTIPYQRNAPELSATVVIGNEQQRPRWTDLEIFNRSEYELFVIYYDAPAQLLFICASRRSDAIYEDIAKQYTGGAHKILPLWKINRVLRELERPDFFSLGMKNRLNTSNTESYRNITGPRAQLAIAKTDGRLFHRGHLFGKGLVNDEPVTIGYSSASKVWSNRNGQLPELIGWCRSIARNLHSDAPMPAHEGISFLSVGEPLTAFPDSLIGADWDPRAYRDQPLLHYQKHGEQRATSLTETELTIRDTTPDTVTLELRTDDLTYTITYALNGAQYFVPAADNATNVIVEDGRDALGLIDYLNSNPITVYTAEFSSIRGAEIFRTDPTTFQPFDHAKLLPMDWTGVNIEREFWPDNEEHEERSIHEHLLQHLDTIAPEVVLYDHRTGEVADIVTAATRNNRTVFAFYHVKGSSAPAPGQRVKDVYEVCGQIIKSVGYINNLDGLAEKLRVRLAGGSRLRQGTRGNLDQLFQQARQRGCTFELKLVQPGLTTELSAANANVLAATNDYAWRAGAPGIVVITS